MKTYMFLEAIGIILKNKYVITFDILGGYVFFFYNLYKLIKENYGIMIYM